MSSDKKDKTDREWIKTYARLGSAGLMFPLAIFLGYIVGKGLDGIFDSSPIITLILIFLGFLAAVKNLLNELNLLDKNE